MIGKYSNVIISASNVERYLLIIVTFLYFFKIQGLTREAAAFRARYGLWWLLSAKQIPSVTRLKKVNFQTHDHTGSRWTTHPQQARIQVGDVTKRCRAGVIWTGWLLVICVASVDWFSFDRLFFLRYRLHVSKRIKEYWYALWPHKRLAGTFSESCLNLILALNKQSWAM